jgi:hypothetical protein
MQPTHRGDVADKINRIYMALILGHETLLSLSLACAYTQGEGGWFGYIHGVWVSLARLLVCGG